MKPKKIMTLVLLAPLFMLLSSGNCKRNELKSGCNHSEATNYTPGSDDSETCNFKGTINFWFDKSVSDDLISGGYTNLRFDITTTASTISLFGSSNDYHNSEPDCTGSHSFKNEFIWDVVSYEFIDLKIIDDDTEQVISEEFTSINANECRNYQINF